MEQLVSAVAPCLLALVQALLQLQALLRPVDSRAVEPLTSTCSLEDPLCVCTV